jgi:hypothetical protein
MSAALAAQAGALVGFMRTALRSTCRKSQLQKDFKRGRLPSSIRRIKDLAWINHGVIKAIAGNRH